MLPVSRTTQHTILLIEADTSLRRLIALGLQHRDIQVIEASSLSELPTTEAQQPGLLLLDIDSGVNSDWSLLATVQAHPSLSSLPVVVLAWDCILPETLLQSSLHMQVTCLTKPFDARTLHTTIENLLATTAPQPEEVLPVAQPASPAPSIWPLVTAAGLLLTFIGVMVQVALVAVGIVIVIAALLWWTLGTKSDAAVFPLRAET